MIERGSWSGFGFCSCCLFIWGFVLGGYFLFWSFKCCFYFFGMLRSVLQVGTIHGKKRINNRWSSWWFQAYLKDSFRGFIFPCSENRAWVGLRFAVEIIRWLAPLVVLQVHVGKSAHGSLGSWKKWTVGPWWLGWVTLWVQQVLYCFKLS